VTLLTAHYKQYILYRFGNTGRRSQNYTKHRESCSTVFAATGITSDSVGECFACHSLLQSSRWDTVMTAVYVYVICVQTRSLLLSLDYQNSLSRAILVLDLPFTGWNIKALCKQNQADYKINKEQHRKKRKEL
jgi:hypothetical protein